MEPMAPKAKPPITGRPTVRNPENRELILKAVRLGQPLVRAAKLAGMTYETLREWRLSDVGFSAALEKAGSEMELAQLARIEQAAQKGNWQASAWKLERLLPATYGRVRLEITGADGAPIAHADVGKMSDEELAKIAEMKSDPDA
jgi:hypothetical protein